jgi:alpha-tubulin suppressor-like RCC1 family protein
MKNNFTKPIFRLPLLIIVMVFISLTAFSQNLQISGGNNFSAAVCDNQEVFVWGANASGQLAIDATDAPVAAAYSGVPIGVLRGNVNNTAAGLTYGNLPAIRQVDAGSGAHVLGLSCASQVWAWGDNSQGQLGRNSLVNSPVPQRVLRGQQAAVIDPVNDPNGVFLNNIFYVSGGNNSSFALEKTTGRVLSWGQNANGELGDGTSTQQLTPVYVLKSAADGGGQLTNIIQIEGGDDCTYALDANGYVWSWGDNTGNKLGRLPTNTAIVPTASRVIQGDPNNNGYSATPTPTVYLSGIIQISGGDTHCLALDGNGNVWSFGGDWGSGQLGRGGGSVYQDDARKVGIPGLAAYATTATQFLGGGVDGKAVYVAAGQASSAVVMANGKVVTFGSRGMYNAGATPTGSGTSIACPTPAGDMIMSGTMGDGNAGCNSTVCSGKGLASQWTVVPVYVTVSGGAQLTGVTQVSDGDAWYYAVTSSGSAYVWGWNRRGELGLGAGDYTDRCFAVPFALPTGCAFSNPCPNKPNLGADVVTCPIFSTTLNSNVPQTYSSYKYTWEYRVGTSGAWSTLTPPGALSNNSTYSPANTLGYYRVTVTDNRGTVPFLCAPCPVYKDSIGFTPPPNPYTVTACQDPSSSKAKFTVSGPGTPKIKWYTNDTGGTALNPSDSLNIITVPYASTNTTVPGCARALWADDVTSFVGVLRPGTTVASAPCAGVGSTAEAGDRAPLELLVTQNLTITSLNFIQPNNTNPYTASYFFRIYTNDPTLGENCSSCSPANSKSGGPSSTLVYTSPSTSFSSAANAGLVLRTLTGNVGLTGTPAAPVKYWIYVFGGDVVNLNCSPSVSTAGPGEVWSTPQTSTPAGLNAILGYHDGAAGVAGSNGNAFNITFNVGTAYACNRILVCVSSTCVLPVEFIYFDAASTQGGVALTWATASEQNSDYFSVQKSLDGVNFQPIGKVKAAGNSSAVKQYSLLDESPAASGIVYYRLVEYDIDGKTTTSDIKSVKNISDADVTVVPNPSNGNFTVLVDGEQNKSLSILIYNALGQVVYQVSDINNEGSSYSKNIDIHNLAAGVYILKVSSSGSTWTKKIIKE